MDQTFIEKLLSLYPEFVSVYGPYLRKDGRKHIILNKGHLAKGTKGKLKTISYPKVLVEVRENRRLLENETVDHNDRDKSNDELSNLIIRSRSEHSSLDVKRAKSLVVSCYWCGTLYVTTYREFCSSVCTGKYGAYLQNGGQRHVFQKRKIEYYQRDK